MAEDTNPYMGKTREELEYIQRTTGITVDNLKKFNDAIIEANRIA